MGGGDFLVLKIFFEGGGVGVFCILRGESPYEGGGGGRAEGGAC